MIERTLLLFEKPGPENTEATLRAAAERAEVLGIEQVVLASTTGDTAIRAAEILDASKRKIIAVTLAAGLWEKYEPPDPEKIARARAAGVHVLTATHSLMGNIESAIRDKFGSLPPGELLAHAYYRLSQGFKVAVEVVLMAADAGLLNMEREVIGIGGTNSGADTAVVMTPAYSVSFFSCNICEIIAMPR